MHRRQFLTTAAALPLAGLPAARLLATPAPPMMMSDLIHRGLDFDAYLDPALWPDVARALKRTGPLLYRGCVYLCERDYFSYSSMLVRVWNAEYSRLGRAEGTDEDLAARFDLVLASRVPVPSEADATPLSPRQQIATAIALQKQDVTRFEVAFDSVSPEQRRRFCGVINARPLCGAAPGHLLLLGLDSHRDRTQPGMRGFFLYHREVPWYAIRVENGIRSVCDATGKPIYDSIDFAPLLDA